MDPRSDDRRGSAEAKAWQTLDDITAAIASELPDLAAIRDVAPPATFRIAGHKVAREPHRYSGRTAMGANVTVHEPKPPDDPDTRAGLHDGGLHGQPPSALIPRSGRRAGTRCSRSTITRARWAARCAAAIPGVRVISPRAGAPPPYFDRIPPPFEPQADEWLCVPLHHIFGSEELSVLSPAIAERMTPAASRSARTTSQRADVKDGERSRVLVGERLAPPHRA